MVSPLHFFLFLCHLPVGIYGFVLVMVQPCIIVSPQSVLTPTPDNEPAWRVRARVAYNVKGLGHIGLGFFIFFHWNIGNLLSKSRDWKLHMRHGYIIEL